MLLSYFSYQAVASAKIAGRTGYLHHAADSSVLATTSTSVIQASHEQATVQDIEMERASSTSAFKSRTMLASSTVGQSIESTTGTLTEQMLSSTEVFEEFDSVTKVT